MATIEVDTWETFITTLDNASSNDIISITADLDCNDNPMSAGISVTSTPVTVEGNGHTIYNMSTGKVVNQSLISIPNAVDLYFQNLNFYNMYRNENYPFFSTYNIINGGIHFTDCNFQGRGTYLFGGAELLRCAVNWDCGINGRVNLDDYKDDHMLIADNTYFSVKGNYQNLNQYGYGVIGSWTTLRGCYFGGEIKINTDDTTRTMYILGGDPVGQSYNNVFNIKPDKPDQFAVTSSTKAAYITPISIYNSDFIKKQTSQTTTIVACTDAEMHDAKALYDKGFDIVVTQ